ncbi:MAG TPA: hydrogenase expression/formation protein HypE [Candidatus Acetothermia bacterium]|nr:hydrogenase expression/formation protein HypE [Candidatus Acetothermia bacterium]
MSDTILLAHGSGGKLAHRLIEETILSSLSNPVLACMDDSAVLELNGRLAFTTDSYVVNPIFFPGGDIGRLAVCGTTNDLAMSGATPLYLSLAFIIEEGFALSDLKRVLASIRDTAREASVQIVTGDTKVVNRGNVDKLYINTAGIGKIPSEVNISGANIAPGDKVILSGSIGDHGIAIMSKREGLHFSTELESDCAPLDRLVADMLSAGARIHALRDPTRGGLATTLNELSDQSGVKIIVEEEKIPVRDEVLGACEMLGFDPLYVANEGKLVAFVPASDADRVVEAMRRNEYGADAAIIGQVQQTDTPCVVMKTVLGASRLIDMLVGDLLPRIC